MKKYLNQIILRILRKNHNEIVTLIESFMKTGQIDSPDNVPNA